MIVDSIKSKKLKNIMYIAICVLAASVAQASDDDDLNSSEAPVSEETQKKMSRYERMKARLGVGKTQEKISNSEAAKNARIAAVAAQKRLEGVKADLEDKVNRSKTVQRVRDTGSDVQTRLDDARADLEDKMSKSKTVQRVNAGAKMIHTRVQSVMDKVNKKMCLMSLSRLKSNAEKLGNDSGKFREAAINANAIAKQSEATLAQLDEKCPKGLVCSVIKKINQSNVKKYTGLSEKFTDLSEEAFKDATEAHEQVSQLEEECNEAATVGTENEARDDD